MKRRTFLKNTAATGLSVGFGAMGLLTGSCSKSYAFDLLLKGGLVLDGSGRQGVRTDVAIRNKKIAVVGSVNDTSAHRVIDLNGLVLAPGFIDVHSHSESKLLVNPKAESKIRQGVTTEILGQDGDSFHPEQFSAEFQKYEDAGIAVNIASTVGQGTIRKAVMDMTDRAATPIEIAAMKSLAAAALRDGALGISSGLEYTPGGFASTQEIIELCQVMQGSCGLYATHMRNEDDRLVEAVAEAIEIARGANIGLHISHLKCQGRRNWDKLDRVLALMQEFRQNGGSVTMDRYPYVAYSTGLSNLMPLWSRAGGTDKFIERLQDSETLTKIKQATMKKIDLLGSWDSVMITSVTLEKNKQMQGKTVARIVAQSQQDAFEFVRSLIIEEKNQVGMVGFGMSEDNTKRILAQPFCMPASDGSALATYGALSQGNPHPRSYGTFPRVLGKYVREEKIATLPEMIRKMTSLPATRFGLTGRGSIAEGFMADLVAFDPEKVRDKATYSHPHQYPEGIEWVVVNGDVVVEHSEHSGKLPGRVLRGLVEKHFSADDTDERR